MLLKHQILPSQYFCWSLSLVENRAMKIHTFDSYQYAHNGKCVTISPLFRAWRMNSVDMISPCRLNAEVESPMVACIPILNGKRDIHALSLQTWMMSYVSWGRLTATKSLVSCFLHSYVKTDRGHWRAEIPQRFPILRRGCPRVIVDRRWWSVEYIPHLVGLFLRVGNIFHAGDARMSQAKECLNHRYLYRHILFVYVSCRCETLFS